MGWTGEYVELAPRIYAHPELRSRFFPMVGMFHFFMSALGGLGVLLEGTGKCCQVVWWEQCISVWKAECRVLRMIVFLHHRCDTNLAGVEDLLIAARVF